jgi:predicted transcriptional regulator of viral defense system
MFKKDNQILKTLSPLSARLVTTLYSRQHHIFGIQEAAEILGGGLARASKVLSRLAHNGVVTRLKSGTYRLVPFEMGFEHEYLGNPYSVARALVLGSHKNDKEEYYLAYGSAFDLHQMITQPQLIVYVSSPKMLRPRIIQGTEFRFVRCKKSDLFGITEMWLDKHEKIRASDLERTLLDGLKHPAYCGGFSEVAKGFLMKRHEIDPQKLIDYALILDVGAVNRRLGYLMELYQIGLPIHWKFLQTTLTATYQLLDPELPAEGPHTARWRLRLNIPPEELLALKGT